MIPSTDVSERTLLTVDLATESRGNGLSLDHQIDIM